MEKPVDVVIGYRTNRVVLYTPEAPPEGIRHLVCDKDGGVFRVREFPSEDAAMRDLYLLSLGESQVDDGGLPPS